MSKSMVPKTIGLPRELLDELEREAKRFNEAYRHHYGGNRPHVHHVAKPWGGVTWADLLRHAAQHWLDGCPNAPDADGKRPFLAGDEPAAKRRVRKAIAARVAANRKKKAPKRKAKR